MSSSWAIPALGVGSSSHERLTNAFGRPEQPAPAQVASLVPYLGAGCGREKTQEVNLESYPLSSSARVCPRRAGDGETLMPAASMAAIFESAPPFPPAM